VKYTGWGNFPTADADSYRYSTEPSLAGVLSNNQYLIARGNGRSYGDSALSQNIIETKQHRYFLGFDEHNGLIRVQSGILLSEILDVIISKGWFLKVTPGTKLITVGGAIASDVHGKNHHLEGCFSETLIEFRLMLPDGSIVVCSKQANSELFKATCGGMGLTGIILDATISLKPIVSSQITQKTIKSANLKATFEAFEQYSHEPYSVAWIDCLATGDSLGKSLLMVGDFADEGELSYQSPSKIDIPVMFPSFALNRMSVKAFNFCYYNKVRADTSIQSVSIDSFFYPLDAITHWNRMYGNNGFTQFQFILPKARSYEGLHKILEMIATSGRGSFLAVLKLYGPENDNYLSFPMEGYSLALDFKIEPGIFEFLDALDRVVLEYGGRHYLAKDARVSKNVFAQGYPNLSKFRAVREQFEMTEKFNSLQSQRLGI